MKSKPLKKINIYLPPEQNAVARKAAADAGMSLSAWLTQKIHAELRYTPQRAGEWPVTDTINAQAATEFRAKVEKI